MKDCNFVDQGDEHVVCTTHERAASSCLQEDIKALNLEIRQLRTDNAQLQFALESSEDCVLNLEILTKEIISNRGCTCNVAGHRCGTNLMLEDLRALLGRKQ